MRIFRSLGKAVLGLMAVLLVLYALWWTVNQFDEELHPDIATLLSQGMPPDPAVPATDNLYYAIAGFEDATHPDFRAAGERRISAYLDDLRKDIHWKDLRIPEEARLPPLKFDGTLNSACTVNDDEYACLDAAAGHVDEIRQLASEQSLRLQRYAALGAYRSWQSPLPLDLEGPVNSWRPVTLAAQLFRLGIALQVHEGQVDAAVLALSADIEHWRRWLAQPQLRLIDKMVANSQLRADFLQLAEILRRSPPSPGVAQALASSLRPISEAERRMDAAIRSSVVESTEYIRAFAEREHRYRDDQGRMQHEVPDLQARLFRFYLPNATLNQLQPHIREDLAAADYDCAAMMASRQRAVARSEAPSERHPTDWLYNGHGRKLMDDSGSYLAEYGTRQCDLIGFQRIVALQWAALQAKVSDEQLGSFVASADVAYFDPYTNKPMRWHAEQHALSFQAADRRSRAHLPLALRNPAAPAGT